MFDLSNPQKREQVLVMIAGIVLCVIVMMVLPGQFGELARLERDRERLRENIEELQQHDRIKDEIQERLSMMLDQALPPLAGPRGSVAVSGYQNWLLELASGAGIGNVQIQHSTATGPREIYDRHVFALNGVGQLDQIAEFLRRFHRTDYLHMITRVSPSPTSGNPNIFNVTFRIEVLALARVNAVHVPGANGVTTEMTDEERQMLATIRDRAILSEYVPPPPPQPPQPQQPTPPPPPPFDHTPFCFLSAIVMVDGKPQCWIHLRTAGQDHPTAGWYFLFEGESFTLGEVRATVRKIEVNAQRIQVAAAGGVYAIALGKSFADAEEPTYFLTGIVDADGNPWTAESTGEPHCVIIHELEDEHGRVIEVARHVLAEWDSFPMAEVVATIRSIDPIANQIELEAAGVAYTISAGGSFSEFSNE